MRWFREVTPGEIKLWSENGLKNTYFEYWCSEMRKAGKEGLISYERFLDDMIVVHWLEEK